MKNQKNNIKIKKTRLERKSGQHDDQAEWAEKRKERRGTWARPKRKMKRRRKKKKKKKKRKRSN